jgi:uncharacterized SAM-binding protein YcdF (DUF218 family)
MLGAAAKQHHSKRRTCRVARAPDLAEQAVRIDLQQHAGVKAVAKSDGQLVGQCLAQACLASARRTMQQYHPVPADDVLVDLRRVNMVQNATEVQSCTRPDG